MLQSAGVAYRGQIVAAVVAESLEAACAAAALVQVGYDARAHDVELRVDHPRLYKPDHVNPGYDTDTEQGEFERAFAVAGAPAGRDLRNARVAPTSGTGMQRG